MTVLSKLKDNIYGREWSFPYNCYEVGHGWTPYCTSAACDVAFAAFKNALPIYSSLYLFTQLGLQRKYNTHAFVDTFKSILTSASFIGFNLFSGMSISCILRNNSDRYYYRVQCLLPALIASYMSLLIERPGRRPALAFYMANMSSELLWKWACNRNLFYLRPLPHGETLLFAMGMACFMRFVRIHGYGHDPVSTALKYLIGPLEAKSRARACKRALPGSSASANECDQSLDPQQYAVVTQEEAQKTNIKSKSTFARIDESITNFLNLFFSSHPVCPHKGISCVDYALMPAVYRFVIGYMGGAMLGAAGNFRLLMKKPDQAFKQALTSRRSVNFGLFLGTFVGASKAVHCALRRIQGRQEEWHSAVAGGLSGLSMLFSPKSTLSTYIVWKCLEQYFFLGVQRGQIANPEVVICSVYAVSVNILLYIFALEPGFIRPSYMKFIDKISDHRLHQVNRMGKLRGL